MDFLFSAWDMVDIPLYAFLAGYILPRPELVKKVVNWVASKISDSN